MRYENGKPAEVTQIVLSTQHLDESWDSKKVRAVVEPYIREALGELKIADDCNWYINPTGKFVIGGRTATPASPAARSSSTPMAARLRMAAARSPARTRPRSIARRPMRPLPRQERRRGQACRPLHDPALLRHRRRPAAVGLCRPARHRQGRRGQIEGDPQGHGPVADRHPPSPRPQQADLCQDHRLWPFRPQGRPRRSFSWEKTDLVKALKERVAA